MWKYLSKDKEKEFLLSLHLINGVNDEDILNKIYTISNNIEKNYKIFKIKKRNGKTRTIYEPNPNLKIIQKNILHNILEDRYISYSAKAYKKGISIKDNANEHVDKDMILKLDIKNFFNNITYIQVYCSCFKEIYFPKSIGTLLTNLCTYNDSLPQGAPTSSYISNIIMLDFDIKIGEYCKENNVSYTRYCDDMTFSGNFSKMEIINLVKSELKKLGLTLNHDKTKLITKKNRQYVTGIVVNKKAQVSIDYRKEIRKNIYYIKKYGLNSHMNYQKMSLPKEKYLNILLGRINFVLEVDKANKEFIEYKKYILKLIKDR
ncbi:MAG: retron St85 family RNA-directed DNA polymerase [Bacilli bacterium]|nr:retron St85 family RNA-directed DNA polymerase [Bacilli bacterium]